MWAYSQDLRERIVKAVKDEGLSQSEVARRFSVSRQTVYTYLKLAAGRGLGTKRPPGRVRKLSPELEQVVLARAGQQDITLQEHCDWLVAEHGVALDASNLWRLFDRAGVSWKKKPPTKATGRSGKTELA